ncbi:uncharacterized protein [Apostichopus japonicus]|uniref:uncharacterized protein n=1 Tax=Stichopus japonicus TaxID=307972 RepID=UPI003AB6981F
MLKHLKMKAAIYQQETQLDNPSDQERLQPGKNNEDILVNTSGEVLQTADAGNIQYAAANHSNAVYPTFTPCAKYNDTNSFEMDTKLRGGLGFSRQVAGSPPDTSDLEHLPSAHIDWKAHSSSTDHFYNSFKTTCLDPSCHCSPKKLYSFSPKFEESCSCFPCQQYPRMVHHNSVSFCHSTAPHLCQPAAQMYCSSDQHFSQHKPLYHGPFGHTAMDWNRFTDATDFNLSRHPSATNLLHRQHPSIPHSSFNVTANCQTNAPKELSKLSLPLSRSTIFDLVKSGNCDAILQTLDDPLHDETSPMYPLALQTVLEILDVIEKKFADACKSDSKVEDDINQLSSFVRSMKKSTCGDSLSSDEASTICEEEELPTTVSNQAAQCPDISSLCRDTANDDETILESTHLLPAAVLSTSTNLQKDTPTVDVHDADGLIFHSTSNSENGEEEPLEEVEKLEQEDDSITKIFPAIIKSGTFLCSNSENGEEQLEEVQNLEQDDDSITKIFPAIKKSETFLCSNSESINFSYNSVEQIPEGSEHKQEGAKGVDQKESETLQARESERATEVVDGDFDGKPEECITDHSEIEEDMRSLSSKEAIDDESNLVCEGKDDELTVCLKKEERNNLSDQNRGKEDGPNLLNSNSKSIEEVDHVADKSYDIDVVDALLDQTLYEGDKKRRDKKTSKLKKSCSEETPIDVESSKTSSRYRFKGYKVRSVGVTEKILTKSCVKTFSRIGEKPSLCVSHALDDVEDKPLDKPPALRDVKEQQDENGNTICLPPLALSCKRGYDGGISNQSTPEIGKCPSNPLSPTSDSFECADLRILPDKSSDVTTEEYKRSKDRSARHISNGMAALDAIRKLPLPKEPPNAVGAGKPLHSKSFHGRLLIQKNSKESPYPIPMELIDDNMLLGDPRLSLTNLVDHGRHFELKTLHWQNEECSISQGENPSMSNSFSTANERDPRIRRRWSEDSNVTVANAAVTLVKVQVRADVKQKGIRTEASFEEKETALPSASEKAKKNLNTVYSEKQSVATGLLPELIQTNSQEDGNIFLEGVKENHGESVKETSDGTTVGLNEIDPSLNGKSVPHPAHEGNTEKPDVASGLSVSQQSVDTTNTLLSFKAALSLLKGIKDDIKNNYPDVEGEIEHPDKSELIHRVSDLKKTVEVSLLTTEVQEKKATGRKLTSLTGLLEDHFILTADLVILGLWLEGFHPSNNELPEFTRGVFERPTAPSLRKIHRWLQHRYELDGLKHEKLTNLISMIGVQRHGKRSRSRSPSTSSERSKRRSGGSQERHRKQGSAKRSDDVANLKDAVPTSCTTLKKSLSLSRNEHVATSESKYNHLASTSVCSSDAQFGNSENQPSGKVANGSSDYDGVKLVIDEEEHETTPVKRKIQNGRKDQERRKSGKSAKRRRSSVSVRRGVPDLPEELEIVKKDVLSALRTRNKKRANYCLEKLPTISKRAHAQLEDENKRYKCLNNVSPDTKTKHADAMKGIQRLIIDCETLVYSLSWNVNKELSRTAKDKIWNVTKRASHQPSYEEELALLLSLRKSYLSKDLWKYIKKDVDERIASLQRKCCSRDHYGIKDLPVESEDSMSETTNLWLKRKGIRFVNGFPPEPSQQTPLPVNPTTPLEVNKDPSGLFGDAQAESFTGPWEVHPGAAETSHIYPYLPPAMIERNNYVERPFPNFQPVPLAMPYSVEKCPLNGQTPYQPPSTFAVKNERREFDWWRDDQGPQEWNVRIGDSSAGTTGYGTGPSFEPPRVL